MEIRLFLVIESVAEELGNKDGGNEGQLKEVLKGTLCTTDYVKIFF